MEIRNRWNNLTSFGNTGVTEEKKSNAASTWRGWGGTGSHARVCAVLGFFLALLHPWTDGSPPRELTVSLPALGGKPCIFGKGGEKGILVPSSFVLPEPLPPGAYQITLSVRFNGGGGSFRLGSVGAGGSAWPASMPEEDAIEEKKTEGLGGGGPAIATIPQDESAPLVSLSMPPADYPRCVRISLAVSFDEEASKIYQKEQTSKFLQDRPPEAEVGLAERKDEDENEIVDEFEVRTIDVTQLREGAVGVTRIVVQTLYQNICFEDLVADRITYDPGMEGKASLQLWNFSGQDVTGNLTLFLDRRIDVREKIAERALTIPAKERCRLEFPFQAGEEELGRGLVAIFQAGDDLVSRRFAFSVVRDVYRVAFHGGGEPMFAPLWWDRERCYASAKASAESCVRNNINCWEAFSWAPSDFDEMTPDEEVWASGQTQYRKTKTCLKAFIETAKQHGVRAISYGKACGGGYPGIVNALRRPELFHTFGPSGFCHEFFSVDVLDRMRENRYRIHGLDEDFWQEWISVWAMIGNKETYDLGCDEIIASAKMFGWDGVRYDGHFSYWNDDIRAGEVVRYCEDRIRKELPGFSFGYNIFGSDTSRVYYRTCEEFKAAADRGGMMMSEVYRNYIGNVSPNLDLLRAHGDEVRRLGGYFLCIYDTGGDVNGALCLAAGARPMGSTSLAGFATRYSAYILDERLRRLEQPEKIFEADPKANFIWDHFIYEKEEEPGKCSIILHLVNVNRNLDFGGKKGPIRNLNAPQKNFKIQMRLPDGCSFGPVFATGATEGWQAQPAIIEGNTITVPSVHLWTMVVIPVTKPAHLSLAALCEKPLTDEEQKKIQEKAEQVRKAKETLQGPVTMAKKIERGPWRKPRDYRDRDHLASVASQVAEATGLLRNGKRDFFHWKGCFYHLHRLDEALARFDSALILESLVENGGTSHGLGAGNGDCVVPVQPFETYLRQDVIILDNVAASAMSLRERLKILKFVEAGGGLLILGGWYTLDKGEFEGSFLEEALPVTTLQHHSLVKLDAPESLEMGPDTEAGLNLGSLDLSEKPQVIWCNNVLPKAGVKILMKAGEQPVVLSSTFGKGHVIVIPLATSGVFPAGKTPYWEWSEWPVLLFRCLDYLSTGYHSVSAEPSLISEEEVEKILFQIDELEGEAAVKALLSLKQNRRAESAREIARYLAQHEDIDPEIQEDLLDYVVEYADEGWADIAEKMFQRIEPSILRAAVTILLKGENKPDLNSLKAVLNQLDLVDRAKLIARSGDRSHLPELREQLATVLEREKFCEAERVSEKPRPHLALDQGTPRLHHPFLAAAAFRCGGGPDAAYQYARGVYHLFFYAWRERWIMESKSKGDWSDTPEESRRKQRAGRHGVRRMAQFQKEATEALEMLIEDFDKMKPEALQAMREIDCHKSMPGVYRLFARLKPEEWKLAAPLTDAPYEPVRNLAVQFILRHGGEDGRRQVSKGLARLSRTPPSRNMVYVLKRLKMLLEAERMPLVLQALRDGDADVYETALGVALLLPEEGKREALAVAAARDEFFARRIRQAYGIGE